MIIWYCYERTTGRFAGSGTPHIDNETHASTEVPVLPNNEYEEWFFDPAAQTWSQLDDHGRRGAGVSGDAAVTAPE